MGAGAASMRQIERQLSNVPDEAVAELVRWFIPRSEQVGGKMRMRGRVYQLSSRIKNPHRRGNTSTVVVQGSPPGAWAIKSYGRSGGYEVRPRRAKALKLSSFAPGSFYAHAFVASPTTGDGRWDRLVEQAQDQFVTVTVSVIDGKLKL